MAKDFMGSIMDTGIMEKGGYNSLIGKPEQPSTLPAQPTQTRPSATAKISTPVQPSAAPKIVERKQKKARVSYYIDETVNDQLKDFRVYQRTVNGKPFYDLSEAVEDGLKLLFEKEGFTK